jgi:hypothetical protein
MTNTNNSTSFLNTQPTRDEDIAANKEKLIQQYPHLLIVDETKKYISSLTTAAKNIRIELKKVFPNIKFSVTTQRYVGGNNISVRWTDGVTRKKVEHIIGKYQYGEFNGMEDIYEYNNSLFNDIFGAAKFVFATRDVTPPLYSKAAQLLGFTTSGIYMASGCLDGLTFEQTEDVHWKTKEIDFLQHQSKNGELIKWIQKPHTMKRYKYL